MQSNIPAGMRKTTPCAFNVRVAYHFSVYFAIMQCSPVARNIAAAAQCQRETLTPRM